MKSLLALGLFILSSALFADTPYSSVSRKVGLTDSGDSIVLTLRNQDAKRARCYMELEYEVFDRSSAVTLEANTYSLRPYIVEGNSTIVETISPKLEGREIMVPVFRYKTELTCFSDIRDEHLIEAIKSFLINGNLDGAKRAYHSLKDKSDLTYLDLGNSEFNGATEIETIRKTFKLKHVNVNRTPFQLRQIEAGAFDACDYRKNALCGFKYKLKVSEACLPKTYNTRQDEKCGVVYNAREDEDLCGCKERHSDIFHCFSGCTCKNIRACAHPKFGIKEIKSCALPEFGVKERFDCEDKSHGIEDVRRCEIQATEEKVLAKCGAAEEVENFFNIFNN